MVMQAQQTGTTIEDEIAAVCADYIIVDGVVHSPGKFVGEPTWVAYLWGLALKSFADEITYDGDDTPISWFSVDEALSRVIGLAEGAWIALWEDGHGFVHSDECEFGPEAA